MDPWSSPWNDDAGKSQVSIPIPNTQPGVSLEDVDVKSAISAPPLDDTADPWSTSSVVPPIASSPKESGPFARQLDSPPLQSAQEERAYASPWAAEEPVTSTPSDPQPFQEFGAKGDAQAATSVLQSQDPWTERSAPWGEQDGVRDHPTISAGDKGLPTVRADDDAAFTGGGWSSVEDRWGSPSNTFSVNKPELFDQSIGGAGEGAKETDGAEKQADPGLDVWASEATQRAQRARHLERDEIDQLKVEARKLVVDVHAENDFQSAFARSDIVSDSGWSSIFGSEGDKREILHRLRDPPSTLLTSNGVLNVNLAKSSPATRQKTRDAIAKTELRGVRLLAPESNLAWQRQDRPATKPDWMPFGSSSEGLVRSSLDQRATTSNSEGSSVAREASGPGWAQTSAQETRSTSGPSFLASFFRGRQTSATSNRASSQGSGSSSARNSQDLGSLPNSHSPTQGVAASAAHPNTNPQQQAYRDDEGVTYTDDPTGPDLMTLESNAKPDPPQTRYKEAEKTAAAPSLLNRWRNSSLFKTNSSSKKGRPGWAKSAMGADDLGWLDDQEESSRCYGSSARYDDDGDESFDRYEDSGLRPKRSENVEDLFGKESSKFNADATASSSLAADPFDSFLAAPVPPQRQPQAVPPGAQDSLIPGMMASDHPSARDTTRGGLMTFQTNLARTGSMSRTSTASPTLLPPPPPSSSAKQNNRVSLPPPPTSSRSSLKSPQTALSSHAPDLLGDFLAEPTNVQPTPTTVAQQQSIPTSKPDQQQASRPNVSGQAGGGGLTADDLLFFDSL